ncbi:hypothetical protein CsSME_00015359 [Camellia sinensis var. sinensis]
MQKLFSIFIITILLFQAFAEVLAFNNAVDSLASKDENSVGVAVYKKYHPKKISNDLKKVLVSADDAVLAEIKIALQFFGRPSRQKQERAAHILLRYEPTYATFSAADNILIPRGEEHLTTLIFPNLKNLRQIGLEASDSEQMEEQVAEAVTEEPNQSEAEVNEALNLAFEETRLNSSNPPYTSSRGDVSFEDIFTDLGDLPSAYPENMAGESLTQLARRKNAEKMVALRKVEAARSETPPAAVAESSLPVIAEEMAQTETAETEQVEQGDQEAVQRGGKAHRRTRSHP